MRQKSIVSHLSEYQYVALMLIRMVRVWVAERPAITIFSRCDMALMAARKHSNGVAIAILSREHCSVFGWKTPKRGAKTMYGSSWACCLEKK
jgi:hypothetical protein